MEKFTDDPGRVEKRRLNVADADETPGASERIFRRYRRHHEKGLEGLFDRRPGKKLTRAVTADEIECMLNLYQSTCFVRAAKHSRGAVFQPLDVRFRTGYISMDFIKKSQT